MELPRGEPPNSGPRAALTCLQGWAAQFYDDASPAQVTDVLVVFAFLVGVEMGSGYPVHAAAVLQHVDEQTPSAGDHARALAASLAGLPSAGRFPRHSGEATANPTGSVGEPPRTAVLKLGHPRRP